MSEHPRPTSAMERKYRNLGYRHVAGVDESGRGCLAGPVVAAAVSFPYDCRIHGLDDSKRLLPEIRTKLDRRIRARALAVGIGVCSPTEIDRLNILWASMEAMRRAIANMALTPDFLLIDGNRCFPDAEWPYRTVIGGDGTCRCISAASIIAKVARDRMMTELHREYPMYGWAVHKGYATPSHYAALAHHGASPHHRQSFRLFDPPELVEEELEELRA